MADTKSQFGILGEKTLRETYCHIFGEMDLYLSMSYGKMFDHAMNIAEQCGYMVYKNKDHDRLDLFGSYGDESAKVFFKNGKVYKVTRTTDEGKNWETWNFKDKIFEVDSETLKRYNKKIKYLKVQQGLRLPMSQGLLIEEIIKRYKIPAIAVGYHYDHVGIETPSQYILHRDNGVGAEFMGVIDK
jgi:hypothetical protein